MFVKHYVKCGSGNCKGSCRRENSAKVQVKVIALTDGSDVVKIPVIVCSKCLGKRRCRACPTRNGLRTSEMM